jgi:hypothetical protein
MGKLPYIQFYPGDWIKDPGLRACSMAARGLWFDILCYMHQATKYGYFLVGDSAPTDEEGSRIVGCSVSEYTLCLAELEKFSVFSRTKNGVIFCRRMIRDDAQRKDWITRQNRHRKKQSAVNGESNQEDSTVKCHAHVTHDVTHDVTHMSRRSSSSSSSSSSKKKEKENIKEKDLPEKKLFGAHLLLTEDEHEKLKLKYNGHFQEVIDFMNLKIESKGVKKWRKQYSSDYATILVWDAKGWLPESAKKEVNIFDY